MRNINFIDIKEFFTKGHERTLKAKKNIAASFLIKGLNVAIGLVLVPLTINYLNPTKYGIWITLSSVIAWFGFFDIGLGNGLRNRFAEAVANNDHNLAKTYVSTTYAVLSFVIGLVLILFYVINPYLNWSLILNAGNDPALQKELSVLALVVFSSFCLTFIFKLIATILTADQQPAKASLFSLISNALSLVFIIVLINRTNGSLLYIGIIFSCVPVIVFFISSFWFFNGKYKAYKPSVRFVDLSKLKDLFSLGIKFFIIQIAGVLLYETNNIIISQLFGPAEVTPYNIAFRYFNIIMMLFIIIISPFWSAFTEAWIKKEVEWIKTIMQKILRIWIFIVITVILMLTMSPWIYKIWIGKSLDIPFIMSLLIGFFIIIKCWNDIFSSFLNGVGKIKLQLYFSIFQAVINIPLAIFLGNFIGISGVLLSNIIVVFSVASFGPIQYNKIIKMKATGIWNK